MEARARAAVARLQELSQQAPDGAPASERPAEQVHPTVDESETISRTLLLAQRTADTTVAEAQAEADRLLAAGRDEAADSLVERAPAPRPRRGRRGRAGAGRGRGAGAARPARLPRVRRRPPRAVPLAQRERITEVAAQLSDIVQRVPGGLADMRRPLLSAADEPADGDEPEAGDAESVTAEDGPDDEPGDAGRRAGRDRPRSPVPTCHDRRRRRRRSSTSRPNAR